MKLIVFIILCLTVFHVQGLPDLSATPFQPLVLDAGKELLMVCIAKDLGDYDIIWRKKIRENTELLAAGKTVVIPDKRISVLHNIGSNRWILSIKSVNITDGGTYVCDTNAKNSAPVYRTVIITSHIPPVISVDEDMLSIKEDHSYEDCCKSKNVPDKCLKFCSFQAILSDSFDPSECLDHLPAFGECMADGRDHTPCCEEQKIPAMCSSVCNGRFKVSTIIEHYKCTKHIQPILGCISKGIKILPSQPEKVFVNTVSPNKLNVSWSAPLKLPKDISHYIMDVKRLKSFDDPGSVISDGGDSLSDKPVSNSSELRIDGDQRQWILDSLEPSTMYEITMRAENKYGSSQNTYRVRAMTMAISSPHYIIAKKNDLEIPDIKDCCIRKGMKYEKCIDAMCDPQKTDQAKTHTFVICAPWFNVSFSCLSNGIDHSGCCKERGLPDICLPLCSGKVTTIDYRYFVCVQHMPVLTNCVLKGYNVLPSAPKSLEVNNIRANWALIQWLPPVTLADTVINYHVYFREIQNVNEPYMTVEGVTPPYLLEKLKPNTQYEIYISAANKYGLSEQSSRILFKSLEGKELAKKPQKDGTSRFGDCCKMAGMSDECLPLCDYEANISTLLKLQNKCEKYSHILYRCSANGRDHTPCCVRRKVPGKCTYLCAGYSGYLDDRANDCNTHLPEMIECMEEGMRKFPGIPLKFHSDQIKPTEISLKWDRPIEDNDVTGYQVYIREEDYLNHRMSPYKLAINTKKTSAKLIQLKSGSTYGLYLIAENKFGSSLPSYVINIVMPVNKTSDAISKARPGRPVKFEITKIGLHEVELSWKPTAHIHPEDRIEYVIYHSLNKDNVFRQNNGINVTTDFHSMTLKNLTEDTQYFVCGYTIAHQGKETVRSIRSDILMVQTNAPIAASIDNLRLVPPSMYYLEGSSVTILCSVTGNPTPIISVYVDGHLLHEQRSNHVSVDLRLISRSMKEVICDADNGYGPGSAMAFPLDIVFRPIVSIENEAVTVDKSNGAVELSCEVSGNPQPMVRWHFDKNGDEIISDEDHQVQLIVDYREGMYDSYTMKLKILNLTPDKMGNYTCYAENEHGTSSRVIKLKEGKLTWGTKLNVTDCCYAQNVSSECIDACVFDVDIHRALSKPACVPELEKMMKCASDGSDHRRCCLGKGVSKSCINWCRGHNVVETSYCILGYAKQIVECFEEGNAILPGPPEQLQTEVLANKTSIKIKWNPPGKNAHVIELYRVFWRQKGSQFIGHQVPVSARFKIFHDLIPGVEYEFIVKAYNHYGKSLPSNRIYVLIPSNEFTSQQNNSKLGIALAVVTVILILLVLCFAVFFIRKKFWSAKSTATGGVAFENPSYLKEPTSSREESKSSGIKMSSLSNAFKVQPNVYEELKTPK